jgi:G6PDH family F420-dependent oxidoreductase
MQLGYALSSEEHGPVDLAAQARLAEEAGFAVALISDHFHPWTDEQGQSPFVWGVLGAIAKTTDKLRVGTGVTCPILRMHPAIVAQAAATAASMLEGRFFLGVGTGENLNEHVLGGRWPPPDLRLEMLEEAVALMRELWEGRLTTRRGRHYAVERARIYTLPNEEIPVFVAAGADEAAELAGRIGDGLISTAPARELIERFDEAGGDDKPRFGQLTVCYAESEEAARKTAFRVWPNAALLGTLSQDLAAPPDFEAATQMVTEDDIAGRVVCGPDPERHLAAIQEYAAAGYDHVYVHQVGPDQEGFLRFYEQEILPAVGRSETVTAGSR